MATLRRSPFGAKLREFREAAALSQEELAERSGLSLRGVSDLERGARTTPRLETVRMLADGLGLDSSGRAALLASRTEGDQVEWPRSGQKPDHLPDPATSFIGRTQELALISDQIRRGSSRLITLTGPGGVGKTRIAIEVLHRLHKNFVDGAVFVELSHVRERGRVLRVIAEKLGVKEHRGHEPLEVLQVALSQRHMLLVLDNMEQVAVAAVDIASLLAGCPGLNILATSRVRLRVAAEQVCTIDPMPISQSEDLGTLMASDAVLLFVSRARAVDSHFSLTESNAALIAAIVDRLQGMPLAIELAAARVRLLPIEDLLNRLDFQLSLLVGGAGDAPDRQRTIRETIGWSYDLLTPHEQRALRALSIFPNGFSLQNAVAVLGHIEPQHESMVLDTIEILVDSSILLRRDQELTASKLSMLHLVREYCLEKLREAGEELEVRRAAHFTVFEPLAKRAEFLQTRADAAEILKTIDDEYLNIRDHISWLIANAKVEDALAMSSALTHFRYMRGYITEGREELTTLLAQQEDSSSDLVRMKGCIGLGILYRWENDATASLHWLEKGESIARFNQQYCYMLLALNTIGTVYAINGDTRISKNYYRDVVTLAESTGDGYFRAMGTLCLSNAASDLGDLEGAKRGYLESLSVFRVIENTWGSALANLNLGVVLRQEGKLDEADRCTQRAQDFLAQLVDESARPSLLLSLANTARIRGDREQVRRLSSLALDGGRRSGSMRDIADSLIGLAWVARVEGDITTARSLLLDAMYWHHRRNHPVHTVSCLDEYADAAADLGDATLAAWCIGAVDGVLAAEGARRSEPVPGQHELRITRLKDLLDEQAWREHYELGKSMSLEEILSQVDTWRSELGQEPLGRSC